VAGVFIAMLNILFVFYTMLKGYAKGVHWQQDYFRQWILQIALDVLIFETLQCMWVHFAVPYLVSKEVNAVYALMQQTVEHLCEDVYFAHRAVCLNAPRYLFVSHQLADAFPQLMESTLVKAYSNHLPGQAGMLWLNKLNKIDKQEYNRGSATTWLPKAFLISLLVQIAAYAPMQLQKMLIRVLEPMILSALTVGFYIFVDKPQYLSVLFVGVALLTGLMVWDYRRAKKIVKTNNLDIPVGMADDEEAAPAATSAADANHHAILPAPLIDDQDIPVPEGWMSDDSFFNESSDDESESDKGIDDYPVRITMYADEDQDKSDDKSDDSRQFDWRATLKALALSSSEESSGSDVLGLLSSPSGDSDSPVWDIEQAIPPEMPSSGDDSGSLLSSASDEEFFRPLPSQVIRQPEEVL
jgi:hypothetical protein